MIAYDLPIAADVTIKVCDVRGRIVRQAFSARLAAGRYVDQWDVRDDQGETMAPGVYFYRLESAHFSKTVKLVVLR